MRNKRGFTLIELLIVIAIITALAAALIPVFKTTKLDAQVARVQSDLDSIKTASIMYHQDTGFWPASSAGSPGVRTGRGLINNDGGSGLPVGNWGGPYIDTWTSDPWGNGYGLYTTGTVLYGVTLGSDNVVGNVSPGAGLDRQLLITSNTSS